MDLATHLASRGEATTTTALRAAGASALDIRRALRQERLIQVRRGAFIGPVSDSLRRYVLSCVAVARTRPGDALCHASALAAYGLPLLGIPPTIHLAQDGLRSSERRPPGLLVRPLTTTTQALVEWPDVAAATPAAALAEAACTERVEFVVVAGDAALRAGVVTEWSAAAAVHSLGGRRGAVTARRMLTLLDGRSESPGESILRLRLGELGIETIPQVVLRDRHGFVARVDLLDEATRTVWEFDGAVKYDGIDGRRALVEEKRREDRIRALGYRVVRVMWRDLEPGRLWELAGPTLRRAAA